MTNVCAGVDRDRGRPILDRGEIQLAAIEGEARPARSRNPDGDFSGRRALLTAGVVGVDAEVVGVAGDRRGQRPGRDHADVDRGLGCTRRAAPRDEIASEVGFLVRVPRDGHGLGPRGCRHDEDQQNSAQHSRADDHALSSGNGRTATDQAEIPPNDTFGTRVRSQNRRADCRLRWKWPIGQQIWQRVIGREDDAAREPGVSRIASRGVEGQTTRTWTVIAWLKVLGERAEGEHHQVVVAGRQGAGYPEAGWARTGPLRSSWRCPGD